MILTCPSCGTQYVVKEGAIPPEGRQVRCASCKHSWHQDPEAQGDAVADEVVASEERDVVLPEPAETRHSEEHDIVSQEQDEVMPAEATLDEPVTVLDDADHPSPEAEWSEQVEDDFGPFGTRDPLDEEPRRSPALKIFAVVLFVALIAAAFWFLAPAEWKARLGVAESGSSELQLMLTHSQRQQLASGNMLLTATGRVVNPTDSVQNVPPIQAELRKKSGELVYSWTISPPARSIPPGGRAPFNSAEMNVPPEGDLLTIGFGAPRA